MESFSSKFFGVFNVINKSPKAFEKVRWGDVVCLVWAVTENCLGQCWLACKKHFCDKCVLARSYIEGQGFQNSTSSSVSFLCFHFTLTLWKFVPEIFHSGSRNFTGDSLEDRLLQGTRESSEHLGWSGIVTGSLCISLGDLVGRNLERVILGHSAALSRQRAWILVMYQSENGG